MPARKHFGRGIENTRFGSYRLAAYGTLAAHPPPIGQSVARGLQEKLIRTNWTRRAQASSPTRHAGKVGEERPTTAIPMKRTPLGGDLHSGAAAVSFFTTGMGSYH